MPDRPTTRPPSSTGKDARRDAAREKARQMRELEARKKRRNRVLVITAGIVAVVLVIGAVAFAVTRSGGGEPAATPPGVSEDGGIVVGQADAPHTVTIFQDYQCPICKQYDTAVGPWLEDQVEAGTTKLEYRPINLLDSRGSTTEYSIRSANAAFCIAGQAGVDFQAFNDQLYAEQPEEGGEGLTDSRLISVAEDAGATDVGTCITDRTYEGFVGTTTEAALASADDGGSGVRGTPTVFVDGEVLANESGQGPPSQEQLATALGVTG